MMKRDWGLETLSHSVQTHRQLDKNRNGRQVDRQRDNRKRKEAEGLEENKLP